MQKATRALLIGFGVFLFPYYAQAISFTFDCIEGSPVDSAIAGQLWIDIEEISDTEVSIRFRNEGPVDSAITRIYFYDVTPDDTPISSPGINNPTAGVVDFSSDFNGPGHLPGGNGLGTVFFAAGVQNPHNGIGPGEWMTINFVGDYASLLNALEPGGDLSIGIHVQSIGINGESGSFVASVPEPTTLLLLGSGLACLGIFGRRKARRRNR